ncbi:hypothetical protein PAXRUDRAFT_31551 [Paxillus rubicundulus Ve08.2h10]|uniref:FAD/NAD(P)-binding domain-containing protein n=1 Tax=Paxillus rubicundulus Ve08.2h10 TaxID=930991 RepID=A0A0D0DUA9_9AGAM|nr:hypothetical protein PAXRUDRAFT_31551 [Paxillus rubicundulus Ve08.2h10]
MFKGIAFPTVRMSMSNDPFPQQLPTPQRVIVIGAGHTGLEIAARLKCIGIPHLVVDKNARVGGSVALLTTPLKFPSTWPVYSPATQLAGWLGGYASYLELNVWTSSTITKTDCNDETETWTLEINREGKMRTLKVKHLVFATGYGGCPIMPNLPGKSDFKGKVVHSSQFTPAGKSMAVVDACNSGHYIAQGFFNHGHFLPNVVEYQRTVPFTTETTDKAIFDGLAKAGFKINLGPYGAGLTPFMYDRSEGYDVDTGTSQHNIDGDIKIQDGGSIERFTETGLKFADGSGLEVVITVFFTG